MIEEENNMVIGMYRDTASHYGLCEDKNLNDNEIAIDVPEHTLEDYYNDCIAIYQDNPIPFDEWITEEYTYDDMEDLLLYIEETEGNLNSVKVGDDVERRLKYDSN